MDRTSTRAWRRIQNKRVWRNRLRRIFRTFFGIYVNSDVDGEKHEPASWKELRKVKGFQVYRTTGTPCSCPLCAGERYNRMDYRRDTVRCIREQSDSD